MSVPKQVQVPSANQFLFSTSLTIPHCWAEGAQLEQLDQHKDLALSPRGGGDGKVLEAAPKGEGNPLSLCRWELQETPELPHPAPAPTALLGLSCCCTNPLPSCPSYPRADISGEDLNSSNCVKISPKPLFQHRSRNKNTTPVQAASSAALTLECPNPPQASCAAANGCDQVQLFYRDQIQLALPVHHSLQLCLLWMNLPSISTAL